MMRLAAPCGASLLVLVACGGEDRPPSYDPPDDSPAVPYERLPEVLSTFDADECDTEFDDYAVECGFVTVPEAPGSEATMRLAVMRVFSDAEEVEADPVVYLNGGPGGATLESAEFLVEAFEPFLGKRDLILVDQRGTGASKPSLSCTEGQSDLGEALDACFTRLSKTTDLSATDTVANARDLDLVRQAFGYDQWNLFGISYGTRLGLTIARDYPQGVRSLIVDSVVPLEVDLIAGIGKNGQDSFEVAFAACQEDSACAEKYPDSMTQLREVVAAWNAEPAGAAKFTGEDLVDVLFTLVYSPTGVEILPFLIDQVATGELERFQRVHGQLRGGGDAFAMHLSLHCAEELPFTSQEKVATLDDEVFEELRAGLSGREYFDYCAHWPVEPAPPSENEPVVSDIPSLVLSGKFDPITPPANAALVHQSLSRSQYFNLENESHGASTGECGLSIVQAFLDAPTEDVPATCLGDLPELEFQSKAARPSAHSVDGRLRFVTSAPSNERLDEIVADAKRRSRG